MRKVLIGIIIVLLAVFTGIVIYKGTSIGKFDVWGIKQISEKNDEIDSENQQLGTLVASTYPNALASLNTSSETLQETKDSLGEMYESYNAQLSASEKT